MSEKLLYKVPEACDMTGIGRSRMYELIAAGTIASVKVGKLRLIPRSALVAFVDRLVAGSASS